MPTCHLYGLPNESSAPPPYPDTHRIYALILRILQTRLVTASTLENHSVLLEAFTPAAKFTEPPYHCTYRGTDGLSTYASFENDPNIACRLGELRNLYSRFRPYRRELETGGRRVRRRPGDVPGSRTWPGTASEKYEGETVKQILNLDSHELFTQLCALVNLVKIGPRHGLFTAFVEIEEGWLRVWRDWLKKVAERDDATGFGVQKKKEFVGKGKEPVRDVDERRVDPDDESILWVKPNKNVGMRLNVREKKDRRGVPILMRIDEEDMPVSYELEHDELLIRTSHLLLMLEKSVVQEDNPSGKAVVFGSFG
ncbi:F-box domain-containing protein [Amniculicola lignicola CBS 123094]|uniref:F-box domain-containing protein n=1 Tax=Amniculicola lignicola CBS 123094 TaxID=1392246 RepID=A0A6A5W0K1_9PLEO|nr:F-box domain-containing protein [Amniculicola lignicola CBS 123094]